MKSLCTFAKSFSSGLRRWMSEESVGLGKLRVLYSYLPFDSAIPHSTSAVHELPLRHCVSFATVWRRKLFEIVVLALIALVLPATQVPAKTLRGISLISPMTTHVDGSHIVRSASRESSAPLLPSTEQHSFSSVTNGVASRHRDFLFQRSRDAETGFIVLKVATNNNMEFELGSQLHTSDITPHCRMVEASSVLLPTLTELACIVTPGVPRIVIASDDEDCDNTDPSWHQAPNESFSFDFSASSSETPLSHLPPFGALYTDDCGVGDPTWMPVPPFSALMTVGQYGGRVWRLQSSTAAEILDFVSDSSDASDYSYNNLGAFFPFTENSRDEFQNRMQAIIDRLSHADADIRHEIEAGKLPYFLLRIQGY